MTARPWVAEYDSWVPEDLRVDKQVTVFDLVSRAIRDYGSKNCFACQGVSLTYSELGEKAICFAAQLSQLGLTKGDRVAVVLPNILEFPVAFVANLFTGLVQVNVNPNYTAREIRHQLCDADVKAVIYSALAAARVEAVLDELTKDIIRVRTDDPESGRSLILENVAEPLPDISCPNIAADDLLFIQYTGGTTGFAKGALLTHGNIVAVMAQGDAWYGKLLEGINARVVTALPLYHVFALTASFLNLFCRGAENSLVSDARQIENITAALAEKPCNVFMAVNTLFSNLANDSEISRVDFSALRVCIGGGAPIEEAVSHGWYKLTGQHIRQGYGLTETSALVSNNPISRNRFNGTIGVPVPGTDIVILGHEDSPVKAGDAGELCVRGPQVTQGYWRNAEATTKLFTRGGFLRTGDVVSMTPEGYLRILDRKSDVILVSGFNVYPAEIEVVAAQLDGVKECACIGKAHPKKGNRVVLFVACEPWASLSEKEVKNFCSTHLAAYKRPSSIRFVEQLPRTTVGKVLRRELREIE